MIVGLDRQIPEVDVAGDRFPFVINGYRDNTLPVEGRGCIANQNTIGRICSRDSDASCPCSLLDNKQVHKGSPQNGLRLRR